MADSDSDQSPGDGQQYPPPGQNPPPGYYPPPGQNPPPGYYPPPGQYPPPGYGANPQYTSDKKVPAGVLGILLGGFGVHRFYLNDPGGGLLRILITVLTCGFGSFIGLIEGIIYLTKTDAEFDQIYLVERRSWF